jgi:replicative DNA helicase
VRAEGLKTGTLIDVERKMLQAGADALRPLPIWITNVNTTEQLSQAIEMFTPGTSNGLGLVAVDYLQLVRGSDRDTRTRIERVSQDLKHIALKYGIAVVVLSSLSRPDRANPNWEPSLGSLRDSGALEHDADTVLLMSRNGDESATKLVVAKQRDGRTGTVMLDFRAETLTFTEA